MNGKQNGNTEYFTILKKKKTIKIKIWKTSCNMYRVMCKKRALCNEKNDKYENRAILIVLERILYG